MSKIIGFKNNLEYYLRLYDTRKNNNDLLGALDAGRSALKNAKTRITRDGINILIGEIFYEMGLYKLSCEYYFRAVKVPQNRASSYFGIGRNLVKLNNNNLALDYFEQVLNWDFDNTFSEAILEWIKVIKSQLNNNNEIQLLDKIKFNIAKIFSMREYDKLINYLSDLINIYPESFEFKKYLIECHFALGNFCEARKIIFQILQNSQNNIDALMFACRYCIYENDYQTLNEYLSRLESLGVEKSEEVFLLGCIYFDCGNYTMSIKKFEQMLQQNEYRPKLLLYIAICYYNIGDLTNAIYYVSQARWIDYESSLLNQFYNYFKQASSCGNLPLSTSLPAEYCTEKMQQVWFMLNGNFEKSFLSNINVMDDIEWALSVNDNEINNCLSEKITRINKRKAQDFVAKTLLSIKPTSKQKFLFTRNALCSGHFKYIDVTTNLRYRSFNIKLSKSVMNCNLLRNSASNAIAFVGCIQKDDYDIYPILKIISKAFFNYQGNNKFDEKVITCAYFYQKSQFLLDACIYFGVDVQSVECSLRELGIER